MGGDGHGEAPFTDGSGIGAARQKQIHDALVAAGEGFL